MSRRNPSNPISLFPFLAVLVSTMGALILLLLVLTRQAQRSRDAAAARDRPTVRPELPPLPAEKYWPDVLPPPPFALDPLHAPVLEPLPPTVDPVPALLQRRRQVEQQLSEQNARDHRRLLEQAQLQALADRIAELERRLEETIAARKQRVDHIEHLYRTLEDRRVKQQKQAAAKAGSRYAIVPYTGASGTRQRPIFLECTNDAIVLQPEGVRIGADVLVQPENPSNPLALVVAAVADALRSDNPGESPYPLFVVRPAGIAGYYLARQALAHLELPSGYELVDQSIHLEYPPQSERLRELAEAALRTAPRPVAAIATSGPAPSRPVVVEPASDADAGLTASAPARLLAPTLGPTGPGGPGGSQRRDVPGNRPGSPSQPAVPAAPQPVTFDQLFFAAQQENEPAESSLILPEAGERSADANFLGLPVAPRWFHREISVDCHGDRLVLGLGGERIALGPLDPVGPAVTAVLNYAKAEINRWRRAGQLHQFRPVLVFRVHPDGLQNYYRMRLALRKSNVSVEHRLADVEPFDWAFQLGTSRVPQTR